MRIAFLVLAGLASVPGHAMAQSATSAPVLQAAPPARPQGAAPPAALPAGPGVATPSHRGVWLTDGGKSRVEVADCGPQICARIVWLKEPNDEKGKPLHDGYNKNAQLRSRPILGLPLFENMRPARNGWEGRVYNPEEGDWFDVNVWLSGPDKISIKGCVLFICETHNWLRATGPAPQAAAGSTATASPVPAPVPAPKR